MGIGGKRNKVVPADDVISGETTSTLQFKQQSEESLYVNAGIPHMAKGVRMLSTWLVVACIAAIVSANNVGELKSVICVGVAIFLLLVLCGLTFAITPSPPVCTALVALAGIAMTIGMTIGPGPPVPIAPMAYVVVMACFNFTGPGFPVLPFVHLVVASVLIILPTIILTVLTASDLGIDELTGVTRVLSLLITVGAAVATSFQQQRVHRVAFTNSRKIEDLNCQVHANLKEKDQLKQERHELRTDVFVSMMESVGAPIVDLEKLDLDSPLEQAISIMKKMMDDPNLPEANWKELKKANVLLAKSDILSPDLQAALEDKQIKVDAETEAYLLDVISNGTTNTKETHAKTTAERTMVEAADEVSATELPGAILPKGVEYGEQKALRAIMSKTEEWTFDVLEVAALSNGRPLLVVGFALFNKYGLIEKFNIDQTKLRNFLNAIESGYQNMPYHNSTHAADVSRTVHYFLHNLKCNMTDEELLASVTASIIHDFDHPGRTNNFLIATSQDLALLYNDKSVLEQHHCSQAHFLVRKDEMNIFQNLTETTRKSVRKTIVELVLATDLSGHFKMVAQFKKMISGNTLDTEEAEGRLMVLQMCLKCGDLGHAAKPLKLHEIWTMKVSEEFYAQGDDERAAGIPISAFSDRNNPTIGKSQVGFLKFLVIPMFEEFMKYLDPTEQLPCMKYLKTNYEHWSELDAQGQ